MADNFVLAGDVQLRTTEESAGVHVPHVSFSTPGAVSDWISMTVETSALDAGDVAGDNTAVASFFSTAGGVEKLASVQILDPDDNTAGAMTLYLLDSNVSIGTLDGAPNISDANAVHIIGLIPIASGDWVDIGGAKMAHLRNLNAILKAADASTTLYCALCVAGTPTFAGGVVKLRFGRVSAVV